VRRIRRGRLGGGWRAAGLVGAKSLREEGEVQEILAVVTCLR
jgi:hypothetical protein